jgi:hypothetical protein
MSGNELNEKALVATRDALSELCGFYIHLPFEGDLDDLERSQYEGLEAAILAYNDILSALSPQPVTKPAMGGGWMPIETLPIRSSVLLWGPIGMTVYTAIDEHWREDFEFTEDEPTHWMPLPAPPATTGGEEL